MAKRPELGEEVYNYLISTMGNRPRISYLVRDLYCKRWKNTEYEQKSLMKEFIDTLRRNEIENPVFFAENVIDMLVTSFSLGELSRENSIMLGFITTANEGAFRTY